MMMDVVTIGGASVPCGKEMCPNAVGHRGIDAQEQYCMVRFQVLTAASIKMAVFWVFTSCSLVEKFTDVLEVITASIITVTIIILIITIISVCSNILALEREGNRGSSVGTVSDYGVDDRGSIPGRGRGFFF
jgi:hypothetical protein